MKATIYGNHYGVRRAGISLIEILISIGVAAIGLLGVASLIPVAQHQAIQGTIADRAAVAGHRGLSEFRMRGMDHPQLWYPFPNLEGLVFDLQTGQPNGQALLIDPLGFASFSQNSSTLPLAPLAPGDPNSKYPPLLKIPRISLRSGLRGPTFNEPMGLGQAQSVFQFDDDLLFELVQNDAGAFPLMRYWASDGSVLDTISPVAAQSGASALAKKRYADGSYSWIATLVPERGSDQYILSVAVIYQRTLSLENAPSGGVRSVDESWALVEQSVGGEFDLRGDPSGLDALKTGHWVLLAQRYQGPLDTTPKLHARWYRVRKAAHQDGTDFSQVSLEGPDWPVINGQAGVILFKNVVDVYERVIHLDPDGQWLEIGRL